VEASDVAVIEQLTYRYALYNDTFRIDELVDLFTPDGVIDFTQVGMRRHEGRDSVRGYFEHERRVVSHLMHITTNHLIEIHGDTATGTVYFLALAVLIDGQENPARGYYEDVYARTPDGWRFRSRVIVPLLPFSPVKPKA
jgi:ketosteroid isomerase-like protein